MKKIRFSDLMLIAVGAGSCFYLLIAFLMANTNPMQWSVFGRGLLLVSILAVIVGAVREGVDFDDRDDDDDYTNIHNPY